MPVQHTEKQHTVKQYTDKQHAEKQHTEKRKKNSNLSIELFRILFTFVIVIHHASSFPGGVTCLWNGYLCVEFFFILAGFFLYRSFRAEKEHSTFAYLKKRLRRLYPEYLFAALVCILVLGVLNREFDLSKAVNELLMLQNTGIFHLGGYNFPCWYTWGYMGPVSFPLLRGLNDMSVGVLLCALVMDHVKLSETVSLLLEIVSVILIFLGLFTDFSGEMVTVTAFLVLILSLTAGENPVSRALSENRVIAFVSNYSYTLYLNHGILVKIFQVVGKKVQIPCVIGVYLVLLIIYSLITKKIVDTICGILFREKA